MNRSANAFPPACRAASRRASRYLHRFLTGLSACLLVGILCPPSPAGEAEQAPPAGWTPELSMRYRTIDDVAMSPDGSLIAYVVRKPVMDGEKSEYLSHIWVVSADGATNFQYTQGEKSCTRPAFSPDGRRLAFLSSRGPDKEAKAQVWMMRVRGGEAEQVTDAETGVAAFKWSPDGTRIAYTMRDADTEAEKKDKKEKRDVVLVDRQFKYNHLYTVPVAKNEDGKRETKRLTTGTFHISGFDWSPDGRTIVFTHQPDPRINTGGIGRDIASVPADSGAVTQLVTWPGADNNPRYSPDGRWVAFTSHGGKVERIGLSDVYVIPAAGGTPEKLAETPDRNAALLAWSSDNARVYVRESYRTTRRVFAVPLRGKKARDVTPIEGAIGAVAFDRATDRMAFTYQTSDTPVDVYTSGLHPFRMTRLTDLHAGVPRPPMGRTEVITWKSFDGREIQGLLTYPLGYRQDRRYPLILNIHGGPAGMYARTFTGAASIYMIQYFARQGYAVLRPNPRGSTGYGKTFRYANVKDWGYGDYEDIMAGVDAVIDRGVADPESLAVMGWSYGGYLTSFTVTRTTRFKAASMGAGLPDLISMVSTTDIPDYLTAHMGGEFWEDYKTYEQHSAIYRIKNVTTPTQIIHGAKDRRVPTSQGYEFYHALDRLGVPTEMIVYPRTPHGPREPKFVMDVSKRIMQWFERYVRGKKPGKEKPDGAPAQ